MNRLGPLTKNNKFAPWAFALCKPLTLNHKDIDLKPRCTSMMVLLDHDKMRYVVAGCLKNVLVKAK
jgi:hypothetical protein